jgi:hypothetical protein
MEYSFVPNCVTTGIFDMANERVGFFGFYIPEDDDPHNHCRENPKPYIALTGSAL